ncbi:MAG: hypothetical protein HQ506_04545 [Candidatus Marinimicrobia bacterium]|nr:hypothetical protein [Candidatus Neomarinimicrobiota bacterium]
MKKNTYLLLIILLFISCENSQAIPELPDQIQSRISELSGSEYAGTIIYRYDWRNAQYYHVMIPISSCAFCEMYDEFGNVFEFSDNDELDDFLANRKNEYIVWAWSEGGS